MRIAYLTQSYPPMVSGASIVAEQLAKGMAKCGHQVLVVAASDRDEAYHSAEENLIVLRLASINNPLRVNQRSLLYPRHAVIQALKEFHPDVIHAHEPLLMGWLGLKYAQRAKIPAALTTHQLPWFIANYLPDKAGIRPIVEALLWEYARWILKKFTVTIAPTRTISNVIKEKIGAQTRSIAYGIDPQVFHPNSSRTAESNLRRKLNIPSDVPVILHVGRLDVEKCVERVVFAAEKVVEQSNACLLLVGDGRQKPALMDLCQRLGIESRVRFTGFVSNKKDLSEIYRLASVFVTASEIETQGIVLLEAAASGLPIVAVRATCVPEIVRDEVNGYLAEPGDIQGLGRSIAALLQDSRKAEMMGKASRKIAEKYDVQHTMDAHEKLYLYLEKQNSVVVAKQKTAFRNQWKWMTGGEKT